MEGEPEHRALGRGLLQAARQRMAPAERRLPTRVLPSKSIRTGPPQSDETSNLLQAEWSKTREGRRSIYTEAAAPLRSRRRRLPRALPCWPRNLWSSGSACRRPYIVAKEGESRDSWRRRLPSFWLRTSRAR